MSFVLTSTCSAFKFMAASSIDVDDIGDWVVECIDGGLPVLSEPLYHMVSTYLHSSCYSLSSSSASSLTSEILIMLLLLSCDESSKGGFELGLLASDVLSPSSSSKHLVFFFFFGLRSSLAFCLIFLMVELAFDARDLKDCVLDLIEALLHFNMV